MIITVIDPETYENFDAVVESFVERRKGKATPEAARELLKDVTYFGTIDGTYGISRWFSIWCSSLYWRHCTSSFTNY